MTEKAPRLRGVRIGGAIPHDPWLPPERPDWMTDARRRCAPTNPDWKLWTSEIASEAAAAAKLCRQACPFVEACDKWATQRQESAWVWGGRRRSVGRGGHHKTAPAVDVPPTVSLQQRRATLVDQVRELWAQSLNDGAIALRLGIDPTTVAKIRRRTGLKTQFGPGGHRKKEAVST